MACPCLPSKSEELEGFDPTIALECSQLAMSLAYEPDVGFRVGALPEFHISTSGIVFTKDYERDGARELLVCCRGTLFGVASDMLRNISFKVSTSTVFKGYKGGEQVLDGLKGLADEKVHRQYLDRAMGCLFSYLLLAKMNEGAYDIGKYKRVIVTGHSQGGAVAQVFAALLVGMDKGLRDLRDGYIDTLEINDWSGSVNIFGASKTELTSSKLTITMTTNADGADVFDVKWSGAWEHQKRWLVKDALLQDDRETVSVYAFAPTKIANMAFERWYDLNVPLSFNFIMKYDPVAQMVFPWTRRPGSLIEITVDKTDYLRWLTFPFIDAMLNMMPVLPRRCATKGDFGMDLHGGAVFSAAITEYLLHRGGDLAAAWNEIAPFAMFAEYFGGGNEHFVNWLRLQTSYYLGAEDGSSTIRLDDPQQQINLLKKGHSGKLSDFSYTVLRAQSTNGRLVLFKTQTSIAFFCIAPSGAPLNSPSYPCSPSPPPSPPRLLLPRHLSSGRQPSCTHVRTRLSTFLPCRRQSSSSSGSSLCWGPR